MEREFLHLINVHRGIIYKVCTLYVRDKIAREDLFQDILVQLWRSFPSFKGNSQVSTWMYRVALNTAISQFRKDVKQPERLPLSREDFEIPDLADETDNERRSMLKQAIDQLNEIEKALILLYLEEKSYSEISAIVGLTVTNVGVRLNRIKSKLEKLVQQQPL